MKLAFSYRKLATLACAMLVASCQMMPEGKRIRQFATPRFDERPPMVLKVANIEVQSEYEAPFRAPNIEHLMPVPPEKAVRQWVKDRVTADGVANARAVFIIKDASATDEETEEKVAFMTQRKHRYVTRMEVVLKVNDPATNSSAETSASAWSERTLPEDASIDEREQVWYEMVKDLMGKIDQKMETGIHRHLSAYLGR